MNEQGVEARVRTAGISPAMSAAYDVLNDAGQLTEERLKAAAVAERMGDDPEAFARHLVKLCRIAQGKT